MLALKIIIIIIILINKSDKRLLLLYYVSDSCFHPKRGPTAVSHDLFFSHFMTTKFESRVFFFCFFFLTSAFVSDF
jgi:hypothetical protein